MSFLIAENIEKSFAHHKALDGLSLEIPEGKIFGLLGPNGAGKTTLIRIINRIIAPDAGQITLNGQKLNATHINQIGYLPEERGLYKKMKVGEQAIYLSRLKGVSKADAHRELKMWFERFEISDWWNRKVEELSKGMQQKIQFVITILHKPRLLIFDEPFSGFDPINANLLKREILALREQGTTIVFSTHNMESVEELCDNIALINKSKKILDGAIGDIKNQYKTNTFEVEFAGHFDKIGASLSANYEMLEVKETPLQTKALFRLLNTTTTNDLLSALLSRGKISAFKEIVPSMNDIFITAVQQNQAQLS